MSTPLETLPRKLNAMRQALRATSRAAHAPKARLIEPSAFDCVATRPTGTASVVSLFAGCGGMDLGFRGGFDFLGTHYERNRFDIIWANEINPEACKTYRLNLGEHIVEGDIYDCMGELPSYADVVIGGFPCQDISINGKMLGLAGKRSSLYTAIVETVSRLRPKVFVAENVGSLLMKKHEAALEKILSDFKALGYNVSYHLYHAEKYGVPQTRERVIFVGTRSGMPEFVHPAPCTPVPITAKEALADLESHPEDRNFSHVWSEAKVSGEQGNRHLVADRPGYTMRAECHGNIQFHYALPRRISMREAARIQSFPDSFRFASGIRATERQIGNAVPPVLAWHLAQAIQAVIEGGREYWGKSVPPEKRISHWLKLADKVATGWKPSKCLFQ